jgi:hypothetical protein
MSTSILAGGQVVKGPTESEVYIFDWDREHLDVGVTIASSSWVITLLSGASPSSMTKDNESTPAADYSVVHPNGVTDSFKALRSTKVRLSGGTAGQKYKVSNTVVTGETPSRTKEESFKVLIQE